METNYKGDFCIKMNKFTPYQLEDLSTIIRLFAEGEITNAALRGFDFRHCTLKFDYIADMFYFQDISYRKLFVNSYGILDLYIHINSLLKGDMLDILNKLKKDNSYKTLNESFRKKLYRYMYYFYDSDKHMSIYQNLIA